MEVANLHLRIDYECHRQYEKPQDLRPGTTHRVDGPEPSIGGIASRESFPNGTYLLRRYSLRAIFHIAGCSMSTLPFYLSGHH